MTKIDVQPWDTLEKKHQNSLTKLAQDNKAHLLHMSNISDEGIANVKKTACEILLDFRLAQKTKDPKKAENVLNRIHIAQPKVTRAVRPPIIP